jgi:hypothetical protein
MAFTEHDWQFCLEYWHHQCAICGAQEGLFHTLAADHWVPISTPNSPGSVPWNILPLCHGRYGCNSRKGAQDPTTWLIALLGKRKARRKLAEIEAFFTLTRQRDAS